MGWLNGWAYRKSHVINSAEGAGTNYQVMIKVHYGAGTDSGEDVYLNENCRTDFGDIRFTSSDEKTELNYWMEEKVDSNYAIFWVEVIDDLSNSNATIYIYYGKSDATTTSNGDSTFVFFDDFDEVEIDWENKWTSTDQSCYSIDNGTLKCAKPDSTTKFIRTINHWDDHKALHAKIRGSVENNVYFSIAYGDGTNTETWYSAGFGFLPLDLGSDDEGRFLYKRNDASNPSEYFTFSTPHQWHIIELKVDAETIRGRCYQNDVLKGQINKTNAQTGYKRYIKFLQKRTSSYLYVDYVFLRKYVDPEPSHGSWGSEEPVPWLKGWLFRKSHVIKAASGAGTLYPVKIKTHFGSGTDSGENVYLNGHCRQDFGDVRFTDFSGTLQLDYWMEEVQSGDYAIFWVEIQGDLNYDQTIFIYYGKNDATTTSNGKNTFLFFDDFNSWDEAIWGTQPSYVTIENGTFMHLKGANHAAHKIVSTSTFGTGVAFEALVEFINIDNYSTAFWSGLTDGFSTWDVLTIYAEKNEDASHYLAYSSKDHTNRILQLTTSLDTSQPSSGFRIHKVRRISNNLVKYNIDDDEATSETSTSYIPTGDLKVGFRTYDIAEIKVDWVFVRKLVDPEPSNGSWGEEEKGCLSETLEVPFSISDKFSVVEIHKVLDSSMSLKEEMKKTWMVPILFGQYIAKSLLKRIFIRISPDKNKDCKK